MNSKAPNSHRKIGILGGSFDPVHKAHIKLAEAAFKYANLDQILFLPARQAPLRKSENSASAADRLQMLKIALKNFDFPHDIETCEIENSDLCYTVDTAKYLKEKFPEEQLCWIIGDDHIRKLSMWKNPQELCGIINFICAARDGDFFDFSKALPDKSIFVNLQNCQRDSGEILEESAMECRLVRKIREKLLEFNVPENAKIEFIPFERMPHSATQIRNALAKRTESNSENFPEYSMLDCQVYSYIKRHNLYRNGS